MSWDEPSGPGEVRNRQRFDLTVQDGDLESEVARLVALGAARVRSLEGGAVELTDPDGNAFRLR